MPEPINQPFTARTWEYTSVQASNKQKGRNKREKNHEICS